MQHDRKWFRHLPHSVYQATDADGTVLYIGRTLNPVQRLSHHLYSSRWADDNVLVGIQEVPNWYAARMVEAKLIAIHRPVHNAQPEGRALAEYEDAIRRGWAPNLDPTIKTLAEWLGR